MYGNHPFVRWLCGDERDRARFAAMRERLAKVSGLSLLVVASVVLTACWAGALLLLATGVALITVAAGRIWQRRTRVPEIPTVLIFLVLLVNSALCVHLSGGDRSPLIPLLAVPVCIPGTCFRPRVFLSGVFAAGVAAPPATMLPDSAAYDSAPPPGVYWLASVALLLALGAVGHVLASTDLWVRHEASTDALTGLYNRVALSTQFEGLRHQAGATSSAVSLLILDIDHFKRINDENGHAHGDLVLQEFAQRLRAGVRGSDLVYRVGGEEFIVLLPGHPQAAALSVAERIRTAVSESRIAGLKVTVSQGVCTATGSDVDLNSMSNHADQALYEAKREGRDRVVAYAGPPVGTV